MSHRTDVDVTTTETGEGSPVLVVHGGGGPRTVAPLVQRLSARHRVLAPTLPGWDGTPRPDGLATVDGLARVLLDLLAARDVRGVAVVGSSLGGWVAAAMAVAEAEDSAGGADGAGGRVGRIALLDAVGVAVPGEPITDFFALDARGLAERAWYDAERGYVDPASLTEQQRATQAANAATMRVYAGDPAMHDPSLLARLGAVRVPALGVWGEADRIVTPSYGRAYLAALPAGEFHVVERAGHLPQLEQPEAVAALLDPFLAPA